MSGAEVPVSALRSNSEFYVEPEPGVSIPVRIAAPGSWGLVHGVIELPCLRLDTMEYTVVEVHMNDTVRLVEKS